jgi:hypothetical protein
MSSFDSQEFNALFSESINRGGDSLEKLGEVTGLYIQEKLRENSFARKILPPQTVTQAELTRRVDDEGFSFIDDLEPDSLAMRINMRGEPDKVYIEAPRYEIRFGMISSQRFQKSENELRSYRMPLTKVIEQNTIKDIQEQEDTIFMDHVRVGLMLATRSRMNDLVARGLVQHDGDNVAADAPSTANRNFASPAALASYIFTRNIDDLANGGALDAAGTTPGTQAIAATFSAAHANYNPVNGNFSNILMSESDTFVRDVLVQAVKIQAAREVKAKCFLLHEYDWTDVLGWLDSEAGLELTSEIVRDGYKYATVGGYTFVTTVRDNPDIVQPGQIYTFPAPEFLGRFLLLEGTKFFIDKRGRFISMEAWEEVGMGFGNIRGLGLNMLAGATIDMPNLFQTNAGADVNTTGFFTLTNDPAAPVA